ncbi:MAG TPA: BMP family protein [Gemmatimonadaceae bacterium]|nr:BMP family protein [Gemmatimonadaceae bacterium]
MLLSTAIFCSFAITLGACSGKPDSASTGQADNLKVALLTPGPISDKSWNGGAYEGLMWIRDSLGAQVSHIQTRTPAEFEENFRQYGAKGFDVVFGHGFEFQDAAARVAPSYRNTVFITTSGTRTAPNVAGASFAFEEASYLAGMVAGKMTRTNILGMIGGTELPPVKRSFAAFEQGARKVNPAIRVIVSYIGNWDDVSAGKEQAIAQISRRADIIFQNADAAGLGVFQAVREAKDVRIIGSNADQNGIAPAQTLGSVVIDLPRAFLLITREARQQGFTGKVFSLGLHDGVVRWLANPQLESTIPRAVRTSVDSISKAMIAGTFDLPLLPDSMSSRIQQ